MTRNQLLDDYIAGIALPLIASGTIQKFEMREDIVQKLAVEFSWRQRDSDQKLEYWRKYVMAISGIVHVNINCSDFDRSKIFYESLGFREFWKVPETNTPEIAAAVGMPPYRVKGALMMLEGDTEGSRPFTIDLLQWLEPKDEEPPYAHLYHYGIARIALCTTDMDADIKKLREVGAEFISEPVQMPASTGSNARFVCFKDPDGTVLELVENPTPRKI